MFLCVKTPAALDSAAASVKGLAARARTCADMRSLSLLERRGQL